jgi:hypothetical protein
MRGSGSFLRGRRHAVPSGRCYGARWLAASRARSVNRALICCLGQIVDRMLRWSHVVDTPSCCRCGSLRKLAVATCAFSADSLERCLAIAPSEAAAGENPRENLVTKKVRLRSQSVKASACGAAHRAADKHVLRLFLRRVRLTSRAGPLCRGGSVPSLLPALPSGKTSPTCRARDPYSARRNA